MQDVEFLYECLDGESDYRANTKLVLKEPTLNELKEERKRLEADLLSSTGRNHYEVNKLLEHMSDPSHRSNARSPLTRLVSSPPSSAGSLRSRASSTVSLNQVDPSTPATRSSNTRSVKVVANSTTRRPVVDPRNAISRTQNDRSSSLTRPKLKMDRSEPTVRKPLAASKPSATATVMSNLNSTGSSDFKPPPPPQLPGVSRSNSVISNASSVGSSTSSNYSSPTGPSSKQTAAQKFRQMVLDHRD